MMKKLLCVLAKLPYPLLDGYRLRTYHLLRNLSTEWDISIIYLREGNAASEYKELLAERFSSLMEVADHSTSFSIYNFSKEMDSLIRKEIQTGKYDVIYVGGLSLLPYVREYSDIPIVADLMDDEAIHAYQKMRFEKNLIKKIKYLKWWIEVRRFQNNNVRKLKEIVLSSPIDAGNIKNVSRNSNVHFIPNGVDAEYFHNRPGYIDSESHTLCFSGVMSFEPNEDAMIYFCKKIHSIIKKEFPGTKLVIVGRDPSIRLKKMVRGDESIRVTGFVQDMRPYLRRAAVYISPLRMGAGMKNKILEAWAMSRPIVSTVMGCAGVEVREGENIVIADDPGRFAEGVIKLLGNKEMRETLGRNGRKMIEEHYSWQSKSQMLEAIFLKVLRDR